MIDNQQDLKVLDFSKIIVTSDKGINFLPTYGQVSINYSLEGQIFETNQGQLLVKLPNSKDDMAMAWFAVPMNQKVVSIEVFGKKIALSEPGETK